MTEHYYQSVQGWTDPALLSLYRAAVLRTPDGGTFVEVGVWRGRSLAYLLVEAANSGKLLRVFGVDHFAGSVGEPALLQEASRVNLEDECRANLARAGYPFELVRLPSAEAACGFEDASLDTVFLDGSHDRDSVRADLLAWLPKVRPGGFLAGHDLDRQGVREALAEVLPDARPWGSCWYHEVGAARADRPDDGTRHYV